MKKSIKLLLKAHLSRATGQSHPNSSYSKAQNPYIAKSCIGKIWGPVTKS